LNVFVYFATLQYTLNQFLFHYISSNYQDMKIANLIGAIVCLATSGGMFVLFNWAKRDTKQNVNFKGRYRYIIFAIILLMIGFSTLASYIISL
jgi:hypothetical protein